MLGESPASLLQWQYECQREGAYCDVTLCVGRERWTVPAHRLVLTSRSAYFRAMFDLDFREKNRTVIDIDPGSEVFTSRESLDAVIEYLYTGNIPSVSLDIVREIFRVSSLWMLDNLQKICEYFIAASLTMANCMDILDEARKFSASILTENCLRFMYSNKDLAEDSPAILQELSKLESLKKKKSKYFLVFHSIPPHTVLEEFLAELKFSCQEESYKKVGLQFKVDLNGEVVVSDFFIRLPTWIDFKQFGTRRSREIRNSVIVSAAAMRESCYFGIANKTKGSQVFKFCGILEYHLRTEGWNILPYLQDSIAAEYRLHHHLHRAHLLFFIEQSSEGPKLKIKNFQQDCLFIRSLEEEALIVEQIHHTDRLDLHQVNHQNIFILNDSTFYQTNGVTIMRLDSQEISIIDLDTESDWTVLSRSCHPLHERNAFVVIMKILRDNNEAQLEVRKYDLNLGFVAICQPEARGYCVSGAVHVIHDEENLHVIGKLLESENSKYGVNSYHLDKDTWTFNYLKARQFSEDRPKYSSPFAVYN